MRRTEWAVIALLVWIGVFFIGYAYHAQAEIQYPFTLYQVDETCIVVAGDTTHPTMVALPLDSVPTCRVR